MHQQRLRFGTTAHEGLQARGPARSLGTVPERSQILPIVDVGFVREGDDQTGLEEDSGRQ